MGSDTTDLPGAITVQPGEESRVFRGDASGPARPGDALALIATQDESPDDGGSQSPLGISSSASRAPAYAWSSTSGTAPW